MAKLSIINGRNLAYLYYVPPCGAKEMFIDDR